MASADRRARVRDEVRQKLIDTAWELFSSHPADSVTMRQIADRAEYSPRTLYLYFDDKEALLGAVVEQAYRRTLKSQVSGPGSGSGVAFLRAQVLRHVAEGLAQPRLYETIFAFLWRPGVPPGECRRAVETRITNALVGLGSDPVAAALVPALLRTFTLTLIREGLGPGDTTLATRVGSFTDFLFGGLRIATA